MPRRRTFLFAPLLLLGTLGAQSPPFATGPLAEVRAAAKAKGRALLIDFSHDAIAPCKRLRDTTWADAAVWQFVQPIADVVRIDPEQDTVAAAEFQVAAYPTIVVLGKDGAELGRILGFVDAKTLQTRLAELVQPLPTAWREREALAQKLQRAGDLDGALQHYLWLWDHGLQHNESAAGVRLSFFLGKLVGFAKQHPPAMAALQQRLDALITKVGGGNTDFKLVSDLTALAEALDAEDRLVACYEQVPAEKWRRERVAHRVMTEAIVGPLVTQRRFADVAKIVPDPVARLDEQLQHMKMLPEQLRREILDRAIGEQRPILVASFATRDDGRSKILVDRLLELDAAPKTWLLVLEAAKAGEHDVACHDYAVRALQELPEDQHERVRMFLKRK